VPATVKSSIALSTMQRRWCRGAGVGVIADPAGPQHAALQIKKTAFEIMPFLPSRVAGKANHTLRPACRASEKL